MNPNQEAPPYTYALDEERPRRSWRRTAVVTVLAGVVIAALGAPLGVLWHFLAPTVPVINAGSGGFVVNDPSPEEYIAADGWFTILGFVFGLVAAIAGWMLLRKHRGPGLLLGVTLGALAAAPVAWWVGKQIGHSAYATWRSAAAAGATYQAPPDLHAKGALLVPAFAAVIVLTLLAGWSNDPDLDIPGAKPGYNNQLENQYPPDELSSGLPAGPDPTAEQAPHAPGPAGPPRG